MAQPILKSKIIEILNLLNIKHKPGNRKWLKCSCPFPNHTDKHPSAGLNTNTGVIHCFTCKDSHHLTRIIMDNLNCNYKTAIEMLGLDIDSCQMPIAAKLHTNSLEAIDTDEPIQTISEKRFTLLQTDIYQYEYARLRGFTNEFCDKIGIKLALSGLYKDYMIIPIQGNGIDSYEARRVMEYEYLLKYFDLSIEEGNYNDLKVLYKQLQEENLIEENEYSYYLNKPKTLYPKESYIKNTLFNHDNLDYTQPLYLTEGLGSVPKIYMNISQNVTCTLGVELSVAQIKLLQNFSKIVLIPDNDDAGDSWVLSMNTHIKNLWLKPITMEDTDENYVNSIKDTKEIEASQYLVRRFFKS